MARPKKPETELKSCRFVMMIAEADLAKVDDWMFARRLRSRGEAVRRLINLGLDASRDQDANDDPSRS